MVQHGIIKCPWPLMCMMFMAPHIVRFPFCQANTSALCYFDKDFHVLWSIQLVCSSGSLFIRVKVGSIRIALKLMKVVPVSEIVQHRKNKLEKQFHGGVSNRNHQLSCNFIIKSNTL